MPELISADLGYISRNKVGYLKFGDLSKVYVDATVLSIRGDVRDYYAARRMFPDSRIRANGWIPFLAKRSALIDIPFAKGWVPLRNRYKAWASLANIKWSGLEHYYQQKRPMPNPRTITIHIGAQWRSKQFPYVAELVELLEKTSQVKIIAGPLDPLPDGISENDISRLVNRDLVNTFMSSSHVIVNDSGPMHLAALLRCRTLVISRHVAIQEWLPPTVVAVESKYSPLGYGQSTEYLSDTISTGWPSPDEVIRHLDTYLDK
jgi:hypothetical protein